MPLELHKIRISAKTQSLITKADKLGLRSLFENIANDSLEFTSEFCKDVSRSVVPVDTLELRDTQIRVANKLKFSASVIVTDDIHRGRGTPQPASTLAATLHSGINEKGRVMKRTQNSLSSISGVPSIGARTSTKNWISVSDKFVRSLVQSELDNHFSNKVYS